LVLHFGRDKYVCYLRAAIAGQEAAFATGEHFGSRKYAWFLRAAIVKSKTTFCCRRVQGRDAELFSYFLASVRQAEEHAG